MLLAGGQGSRLGILTKNVAKPAIPFGGKYRIIDFPLSNCTNSGIDTVGVLTQYQPLELNAYIGSGAPWDLDISNGGVFVLPPYQKATSLEWYKGTANAIYQNMAFIEQYNPDYVLILSGDHIYKMDYNAMLDFHIRNGADATIAVREVPWEEASRFGIMNTDSEGRIVEFEEKPKNPKSNKASMGVYIFTWEKLRRYLSNDVETLVVHRLADKDSNEPGLAERLGAFEDAISRLGARNWKLLVICRASDIRKMPPASKHLTFRCVKAFNPMAKVTHRDLGDPVGWDAIFSEFAPAKILPKAHTFKFE